MQVAHSNGKLIGLLSDFSAPTEEQVGELRFRRSQQTIADMYILKNTPPPTFEKWRTYHLSRMRYYFKFKL